ncbi:hypothetical protein M3Y95_00945100 [Aphelenchoides besseyi]|nr:hypothetical protein M3Y95_00945100 [Aphelenchoides besseyi]
MEVNRLVDSSEDVRSAKNTSVSEHTKTPLLPGTPRRALGNVKNNVDTSRLTPSRTNFVQTTSKRVIDFEDNLCNGGDTNCNKEGQTMCSKMPQSSYNKNSDERTRQALKALPTNQIDVFTPQTTDFPPLERCSCPHDHYKERYNLIDFNASFECLTDDVIETDEWSQCIAGMTKDFNSWSDFLQANF